jgi:hypothetical protein
LLGLMLADPLVAMIKVALEHRSMRNDGNRTKRRDLSLMARKFLYLRCRADRAVRRRADLAGLPVRGRPADARLAFVPAQALHRPARAARQPLCRSARCGSPGPA